MPAAGGIIVPQRNTRVSPARSRALCGFAIAAHSIALVVCFPHGEPLRLATREEYHEAIHHSHDHEFGAVNSGTRVLRRHRCRTIREGPGRNVDTCFGGGIWPQSKGQPVLRCEWPFLAPTLAR